MNERDDPDERDMRRRDLAKRLVSHRARTQTIYAFTGFTRHRQQTLRRRWGVATQERHRGPSPNSLAEFFRKTANFHTATAAALLWRLLGNRDDSDSVGRRGSTTLETGERLCYVYEALQACFPHSDFEFEHLALLAKGLSEHDGIELGHCNRCGAALLIDMLDVRERLCRPRCLAS